jgi:DME family drug/metabolite transporter
VVPAETTSSAKITWHPGLLLEPLVLGTICGFGSAVGYTAANVCLRAVSGADPIWVSTIKAVPTVVMFGPFLLFRWWRYGVSTPPWRALAILVIAAIICQLFGNVAFQWALGVVGIALVVPITLGTMITSGALMGRVFLHEAVTRRAALSMVTLVAAICVLSLGADEASASILPAGLDASAARVAAGVGMACISGLAYSLLGVVIRYTVTGKVSIIATIVTVTATGVVTLGAMSLGTVGLSGMLSTSMADFSIMALAGIFNALAFVALTKSLQLVPVVYVNAINATQATMAALAGILFFAEPQSAALWVGVALTVGGLMLMQQRRKKLAVEENDAEVDVTAADAAVPSAAPTTRKAKSGNGADSASSVPRTSAPIDVS